MQSPFIRDLPLTKSYGQKETTVKSGNARHCNPKTRDFSGHHPQNYLTQYAEHYYNTSQLCPHDADRISTQGDLFVLGIARCPQWAVVFLGLDLRPVRSITFPDIPFFNLAAPDQCIHRLVRGLPLVVLGMACAFLTHST
jgi:hypothetical protein